MRISKHAFTAKVLALSNPLPRHHEARCLTR